AGLDATAERTKDLKGNVARHLDGVALMGERIGGERRLTEEVGVQILRALPPDAIGTVQSGAREVGFPYLVAICGVGGQAGFAVSAGMVGQYDVIPRLGMGDCRSD